jgi:hypothetical protein
MISSISYHHVIVLVHRPWPHLLFTVASVHRRQVLLKLHRHTWSRFKASDLPFILAIDPSSQVMSWSSPPWSHDSMSCLICNEPSIITCASFSTSPSHFHLHGICCSHTCTCGLITCVSHINTISSPKLSLNYQNQTRTFQLATTLSSLEIHFARFLWSSVVADQQPPHCLSSSMATVGFGLPQRLSDVAEDYTPPIWCIPLSPPPALARPLPRSTPRPNVSSLQHWTYHCNICNIQFYFCIIEMKHLQHMSETYETFGTYTCNICV